MTNHIHKEWSREKISMTCKISFPRRNSKFSIHIWNSESNDRTHNAFFGKILYRQSEQGIRYHLLLLYANELFRNHSSCNPLRTESLGVDVINFHIQSHLRRRKAPSTISFASMVITNRSMLKFRQPTRRARMRELRTHLKRTRWSLLHTRHWPIETGFRKAQSHSIGEFVSLSIGSSGALSPETRESWPI